MRNVATVPGKPTFGRGLPNTYATCVEMRKVSWPNRQELITYTIVVLVTMVIVAAFTGTVDVIVSGFLNLLGGLGR